MPALSTLYLGALPAELASTLKSMRHSYGKRGIKLTWVSPSEGSMDFRPSIRKSIAAADGVLFVLGQQLGHEVPGEEEPRQSYLEYAAELAMQRPIPVGVLLLGANFPTESATQESEAKRERQLGFRQELKKKLDFVRTVEDEDDLAGANSQFREFLKGPRDGFPWGLVVGIATAVVVVLAARSLLRVYNPEGDNETKEYSAAAASAAAFAGAAAPEPMTVRDAAPLPPELAGMIATPSSKTAMRQVDPKVQEDYAERLTKLRRLLVSGRVDYSKEAIRQLLPNMQQELGRAHPVVLQAQVTAGDIVAAEGLLPAAVGIYESTVTLAVDNYGPSHYTVLEAQSRLGQTQLQMKDYAQAEATFAKLIATLAKLPPKEHEVQLSVNRFSYAQAILEQGRAKEALPLFQASLVDAEKQLGPYHQRTQVIKQLIQRCQAP